MSQSSWLTAGLVPGVDRRPLKKLAPDAPTLLHLLERWREEAKTAGRMITRIVLAYEAGRDGFWLARWLRADSDEAAQAFRFDGARYSDMMSPRAWSLAGW
jgi:transposase